MPGKLSKMLMLTLHVLGAEQEQMPPDELSRMLTLTSHVLGVEHEQRPSGELSRMLTLTSHVLGAEQEQMPPGVLSESPDEQRSVLVAHGLRKERLQKVTFTWHGLCVKRMHKGRGSADIARRIGSNEVAQHSLDVRKVTRSDDVVRLIGSSEAHKVMHSGDLAQQMLEVHNVTRSDDVARRIWIEDVARKILEVHKMMRSDDIVRRIGSNDGAQHMLEVLVKLPSKPLRPARTRGLAICPASHAQNP
jgi:hypothetical protein